MSEILASVLQIFIKQGKHGRPCSRPCKYKDVSRQSCLYPQGDNRPVRVCFFNFNDDNCYVGEILGVVRAHTEKSSSLGGSRKNFLKKW